MKTLVLLRHGESTWNQENRFTGWTDVDLTPKGVEEARAAGRLLKREGCDFDFTFTSVLKRAIRTLNLALEEMDRLWLPVEKDWRLNERHYGALQGLNKAETAAKFGEEQVLVWRRSYDVPPPELDRGRRARRDARSALRDAHAAPRSRCTECLKDTVARVIPYWNERIAPRVAGGRARARRRARQQPARAHQVLRRHVGRRDRRARTCPPRSRSSTSSTTRMKPLGRRYLGDPEAIAAAMHSVASQGKAK